MRKSLGGLLALLFVLAMLSSACDQLQAAGLGGYSADNTPTPTPTANVTVVNQPTAPALTATPIRVTTSTAVPVTPTLPAVATRTATLVPTATSTVVPPTATATLVATNTATPVPTATATLVPTASPTATQSASPTPRITPTVTAVTNTAIPVATGTLVPTAGLAATQIPAGGTQQVGNLTVDQLINLITQVINNQRVPQAQTGTPVPQSTAVPSSGTAATSWTPAGKCMWLSTNWPQNLSEIQAKIVSMVESGDVPLDRVADHLYPCSSTDTRHDGAIILGPQEGKLYTSPFTLAVPLGGVIDIYPGGTCTGRSKQIGPETLRCYSGKVVQVLRATYWPWDDDNPPTSTEGAPVPTPNATAQTVSGMQCIQPTELAKQKGWKDAGWADQQFGGLRVELTSPGTLPDRWEALASGRKILEKDTQREMVPGFWTVYPPFDCRGQLGYSK